MKLPPKISDEYLFDFMNDDKQQSCTSYPKGLKTFFEDDTFVLTDNYGKGIGELYLGSVDKEGIFPAYFSEAGKIVCSIQDKDDYVHYYNIDAQKGWNVLYYRVQDNKDEISTNNILKKEKDIIWMLFRYSDGDSGDYE